MNIFLAMVVGQAATIFGFHTGPDATARLVVADLAKVAIIDRPFTIYFSTSHMAVEKDRIEYMRFSSYWVNTMSTRKTVTKLQPVDGSAFTLLRADLRDYEWNVAAWRAVAAREPYHRQPWIAPDVARKLRDLRGEVQDANTFHVFAVVRADWFFRETAETERSPSYYDLLYAKFRFTSLGVIGELVRRDGEVIKLKKKVPTKWPGGPYYDPQTGKLVPYRDPKSGQMLQSWPAGSFEYLKEVEVEERKVVVEETKLLNGSTQFKFVDFPKNKADWDKAWGLDSGLFLKEAKFKTANGAVAIGMGDDLKRGSSVARNNRLAVFLSHPNALGGSSLETFDVLDPTGNKDYVQNAPNLAKGIIEFDAQELLITLPNGAQAAFLTAGQNGDRVEAADPKVAIDSDTLDRRVRTPGSCVVCHVPSYGVIPPINMVKELGGPDVFANRDDAKIFDGFFKDWEQNIQPVLQAPYKSMLDRVTEYNGAKPYTGPEVGKMTYRNRGDYDTPLALKNVLLETGMTEKEFRQVARELNSRWNRPLLNGDTIPRRVFEKDYFPAIMSLWSVLDKKGDLELKKGEKE